MYRQFAYADYTDHSRKPPYKYTTQLGVLLKREYPGKLEDKAEDGLLIRERPALDWNDYFLGCVGKDNMTHGERVLYEFWVRDIVDKNLNFLTSLHNSCFFCHRNVENSTYVVGTFCFVASLFCVIAML
jgi:hypothetical protein